MLRLKIVKSAEEEATHTVVGEDGLLHGTKVLMFLVGPWTHTNRTVVGDSYFASVGAARKMESEGTGFIGVVKTATRHFPMSYLSQLEMESRGERKGLIANEAHSNFKMMAYVWMDRDRRYFIATSSSLLAGIPYVRDRWRQVDTTPNANAERVFVTVDQPKACEVYYSACGKIDQHNRHRQDSLNLEKKIQVRDWAKRVNISLFGMTIVDTWLVFHGCTEAPETQKEFYTLLAEELIDNSYDNIGGLQRRSPIRQGRARASATSSPSLFHGSVPRSGSGPHVTPTKRKRMGKQGQLLHNQLKQGRCMMCKRATTSHCSVCVDERTHEVPGYRVKDPWICDAKTGRTCFADHMDGSHKEEV